jgi:hypothetical protein
MGILATATLCTSQLLITLCFACDRPSEDVSVSSLPVDQSVLIRAVGHDPVELRWAQWVSGDGAARYGLVLSELELGEGCTLPRDGLEALLGALGGECNGRNGQAGAPAASSEVDAAWAQLAKSAAVGTDGALSSLCGELECIVLLYECWHRVLAVSSY